MSDYGVALRVLLVCLAVVAVVTVLILLVRGAKRGGKSMQAVGAMLMLFGWGNLRDPGNNTVAEAQRGRVRRGTHSGDPLDDEPG